MSAQTVTLIILNLIASSRVSPALRRHAYHAGWRLHSAPRPADGRIGRLWRLSQPGPVVLIGGEMAPPAALEALDAAVAALARQDLVLGPCDGDADDGGCWLIGMARRRRVPPGLLAGARRHGVDMIAAILDRVPMRLWQVELLALEDYPRLRLR